MKLGYPFLKTSWARHRGESAYPWMWDGLVGAWSFMEGMGDKAYDRSGYGNHGTLSISPTNPGPTWSSQSAGTPGSLSFDGTDDYVDVAHNASLTPTSFTVAVWSKLNSLPSSNPQLVGKLADYLGYGIFYDGATPLGVRGLIGNGSSWASIGNGFTPTLGNWYHYVLTLDSNGNAKLFRDGIQDGSTVTGVSVSSITASVIIARHYSQTGVGWWLNGLLDDVRIYNRGLSASEISALWNLRPKSLHVVRRTQIVFPVTPVTRRNRLLAGIAL